jgi:hypothetical protein
MLTTTYSSPSKAYWLPKRDSNLNRYNNLRAVTGVGFYLHSTARMTGVVQGMDVTQNKVSKRIDRPVRRFVSRLTFCQPFGQRR